MASRKLSKLERTMRKKYTRKGLYGNAEFRVGCQGFIVCVGHNKISWYRDMLAIAIARLVEQERKD